MDKRDILKGDLRRYIENTSLINDLISPVISEVKNADDYRFQLLDNFTKIGELSKENVKILKKNHNLIISGEGDLKEEEVDTIRAFSEALINAYNLSFLDIPIVYRQAENLLIEAEKRGKENELVKALDGMVSAAYAMLCVTGRTHPATDMCLKYQRVGLRCAERILAYLDHDKFSKLSDEVKELVLINARYIRVVSEIDGVPYEDGLNEINLNRMKAALALKEDSFYSEQLPSYNWDYHVFRTLEYIASFTDQNNARGFNEEELEYVYESTKRLVDIYNNNREYYEKIDNTHVLDLYLCRNEYLAGRRSLKDYKEELIRIFKAHSADPSETSSLSVLYAPIEYIMVCDKDKLLPEDVEFLKYFYSTAISYMHKTPKKNSLIFLLFLVYLILQEYREVPGGMDFETMCISMIAAIHPITYVHTLSVAKLSKCLAGHLFDKKPELFAGVPCISPEDQPEKQKADLENFIYHAALCHDLGKITIAETILTYGRNLLDEELDIVRAHPSMGAYLLRKFESTKEYADVAEGHHKWYNDEKGYPKSFLLRESPYRTVIEIITCADCMDASTDFVGRSYKEGKSLDKFIQELKEGSGTRYAPYLDELIEEPQVRKELDYLLTEGRAENYREAFNILKKHEGTW